MVDSVIISREDISLIFKNCEEETENWNIKFESLTLELKKRNW